MSQLNAFTQFVMSWNPFTAFTKTPAKTQETEQHSSENQSTQDQSTQDQSTQDQSTQDQSTQDFPMETDQLASIQLTPSDLTPTMEPPTETELPSLFLFNFPSLSRPRPSVAQPDRAQPDGRLITRSRRPARRILYAGPGQCTMMTFLRSDRARRFNLYNSIHGDTQVERDDNTHPPKRAKHNHQFSDSSPWQNEFETELDALTQISPAPPPLQVVPAPSAVPYQVVPPTRAITSHQVIPTQVLPTAQVAPSTRATPTHQVIPTSNPSVVSTLIAPPTLKFNQRKVRALKAAPKRSSPLTNAIIPSASSSSPPRLITSSVPKKRSLHPTQALISAVMNQVRSELNIPLPNPIQSNTRIHPDLNPHKILFNNRISKVPTNDIGLPLTGNLNPSENRKRSAGEEDWARFFQGTNEFNLGRSSSIPPIPKRQKVGTLPERVLKKQKLLEARSVSDNLRISQDTPDLLNAVQSAARIEINSKRKKQMGEHLQQTKKKNCSNFFLVDQINHELTSSALPIEQKASQLAPASSLLQISSDHPQPIHTSSNLRTTETSHHELDELLENPPTRAWSWVPPNPNSTNPETTSVQKSIPHEQRPDIALDHDQFKQVMRSSHPGANLQDQQLAQILGSTKHNNWSDFFHVVGEVDTVSPVTTSKEKHLEQLFGKANGQDWTCFFHVVQEIHPDFDIPKMQNVELLPGQLPKELDFSEDENSSDSDDSLFDEDHFRSPQINNGALRKPKGIQSSPQLGGAFSSNNTTTTSDLSIPASNINVDISQSFSSNSSLPFTSSIAIGNVEKNDSISNTLSDPTSSSNKDNNGLADFLAKKIQRERQKEEQNRARIRQTHTRMEKRRREAQELKMAAERAREAQELKRAEERRKEEERALETEQRKQQEERAREAQELKIAEERQKEEERAREAQELKIAEERREEEERAREAQKLKRAEERRKQEECARKAEERKQEEERAREVEKCRIDEERQEEQHKRIMKSVKKLKQNQLRKHFNRNLLDGDIHSLVEPSVGPSVDLTPPAYNTRNSRRRRRENQKSPSVEEAVLALDPSKLGSFVFH